MNRVFLQLLAITLLAAGGVYNSTQAQNPVYRHRNVVVNPGVVYGGNVGYGNGFGAWGGSGTGYNTYGNNYYGSYGNNYYGFAPYVAALYPRSAPYGAGYSGGYQPYQEMYFQRLYYGLGY
jgi:hypothetical protein